MDFREQTSTPNSRKPLREAIFCSEGHPPIYFLYNRRYRIGSGIDPRVRDQLTRKTSFCTDKRQQCLGKVSRIQKQRWQNNLQLINEVKFFTSLFLFARFRNDSRSISDSSTLAVTDCPPNLIIIEFNVLFFCFFCRLSSPGSFRKFALNTLR